MLRVLPRNHRLTSGPTFGQAVRKGRRSGSTTLVLHLHLDRDGEQGTRIGLIVSKAVGTAVIRNLVKRRLRHLLRERLSSLPGGGVLVVRALPAASSAGYAELGADLDRCLGSVLGKAGAG